MKEKLERLRQSRCLPYLSILLSFLIVWIGETGSYVWGGLCILISLPLLAVPEYLLPSLFAAMLVDNNCYIWPGLTASRYLTVLFLLAQGIFVLFHERPRQWGRKFFYPAVLVLYLLFSAIWVGHNFDLTVFTVAMNIVLAALMGTLPAERRTSVWNLLFWSAAAVVSYLLFCLNFREVVIIGGRYWFLGETNVNGIGMTLAQVAILFFIVMVRHPADRKGKWRSLGSFLGYVLSLYLLVLTGSRSALLGLVGGCAILSILLLLRSEKGRIRRRQTANLVVTCCLSGVLCLTAPQIQQRVELWKFDRTNPAPPVEEVVPGQPETPETPETPDAPEEPSPEQPETPEAPEEPIPPSREETEEQLQENTDSFWRRMNPFNAHWGKSAGRAEIWSILMEYAIKPHPLTGVGYGNVPDVLHAHGDDHSGAHNLVFAILSDLGLIGLLLLAVPLFRLLWRLLRRKDPAALLPLGLLITTLVNGIGENIYTERFLWFAVGLALWLLNSADPKEFGGKLENHESPVCDPVSVQ